MPPDLPEPPAGRAQALGQAILRWYRTNGRDLPWRRTSDPYHVLVSEVMLQQTQVDRVIPKYLAWLDRFPTLSDLAEAPTAEVIRMWASLGYNSRAVRLQATAREAVERFGGRLPDNLDDLMSLKGIGRYTAGAVACFGHRREVTFWDTNVRRVLSRIFLGAGAAPSEREIEELAGRVLPPAQAYNWHQALMDLGATVCSSRRPRCDLCPVVNGCAAHPEVLFALPGVVERKAGYDARPFKTTSRYFRGRIVDALRSQSPMSETALLELFDGREPTWLAGLLAGLERDGLVVRSGESVGLP